MPVNEEALSAYLELMRAGDSEEAFFGLLDFGGDAVPLLIEEAAKPENRLIRARLVEVIRQYRDPRATEFLGQALDDANPEVWKQALDGLVTIGDAEAAGWLQRSQIRLERGEVRNGLTAEWVSEALEQLGQTSAGSQKPLPPQ